jgi:hypothetical protein
LVNRFILIIADLSILREALLPAQQVSSKTFQGALYSKDIIKCRVVAVLRAQHHPGQIT